MPMTMVKSYDNCNDDHYVMTGESDDNTNANDNDETSYDDARIDENDDNTNDNDNDEKNDDDGYDDVHHVRTGYKNENTNANDND